MERTFACKTITTLRRIEKTYFPSLWLRTTNYAMLVISEESVVKNVGMPRSSFLPYGQLGKLVFLLRSESQHLNNPFVK